MGNPPFCEYNCLKRNWYVLSQWSLAASNANINNKYYFLNFKLSSYSSTLLIVYLCMIMLITYHSNDIFHWMIDVVSVTTYNIIYMKCKSVTLLHYLNDNSIFVNFKIEIIDEICFTCTLEMEGNANIYVIGLF